MKIGKLPLICYKYGTALAQEFVDVKQWDGEMDKRWKFPKSDDFQEMAGAQTLSGRILAGSLVPEPKSSLKCSLGALVSGTNLRFSKKKFTFPPLFRGSLWKQLITHHHCCRGMWGELPRSMRPRHQVLLSSCRRRSCERFLQKKY